MSSRKVELKFVEKHLPTESGIGNDYLKCLLQKKSY